MPAGNTHSSRQIYQRLAVNEVTPGRWSEKMSKWLTGFQLKDGESGKWIYVLVICFDNRFNVAAILLCEMLMDFTLSFFFSNCKNFRADWKRVFVSQWVWWKDQKTLSDQDSLWQSFLSSAGRLVRVFSASQSRNLDDFYFLLRCCDGVCPLHNTTVSIVCLTALWFPVLFLRYAMCWHVCKYCISVCVCVCGCFYVCMVVAWAGVYVFSASVTCQEAPLLCCWVPPLQTH